MSRGWLENLASDFFVCSCVFSFAHPFPFFCISEKYNFLGISIVGQSNDQGDGGIYIGSIMKGGAVAADGRIEPGDMLLQVSVKLIPFLRPSKRGGAVGYSASWVPRC